MVLLIMREYIYTVLNEPQNSVLRIWIGAHFTLPGLGAVVRVTAIIFFPKDMQ